ncbi:hypothetical protein RchiOBHm_Chr2g0123791 [Rosa chinensis]|uniref:Uncharacterized protein n=1 Tax=Rosa chinensis TaxID=74649 RepID=A0A2P6RT49_ROSCH|nr:hypothetical protein RchiOBHm_Chr2g0123791 [Rosa chinensis]
MAIFSAFLNCFMCAPSSSSSQVSDDAKEPHSSKESNFKSKSSKSSLSGAPIVVSHFPHNSYISRL